jgi:hypothetical protein
MSGFFSRNKTLAGAARANLNTGGIYFEEGTYLVEVQAVKMQEVRNGEAFIVETTILESTNPTRTPGMNVSWYVGFKVPEASERDIYLFFAACFGHAGDNEWIRTNLTPEVLDLLTSKSNPVGERKLRMPLVVTQRPNKTNSGQFSVHRWGNAQQPLT